MQNLKIGSPFVLLLVVLMLGCSMGGNSGDEGGSSLLPEVTVSSIIKSGAVLSVAGSVSDPDDDVVSLTLWIQENREATEQSHNLVSNSFSIDIGLAGLEDGNYTLKLQACDTLGNLSAISIETFSISSDEDDQTVEAPFFSPTSGTTFTSTLTVSISSSTSGAEIYYTLDNSSPVPGNATTFLYNSTDGITISSDTTFRAVAVKSGLQDSQEVSVEYYLQDPGTTNGPQNFTAVSDSSGNIVCSWNADANLEYTNIEVAGDINGPYSMLDQGSIGASSVTITNPIPYQLVPSDFELSNVYFRAQSILASGGISEYTTPVSFILYGGMGNINAELEMDNSGITVSWAEFPGADHYNIYKQEGDSNGISDSLYESTSSAELSYFDSNITYDTWQHYAVQAVFPDGSVSALSYVTGVNVGPEPIPAPANLTVTDTGSDSVTLSWDPVENATADTYYMVRRYNSLQDDPDFGSYNIDISSTSFTWDGLIAETTYYFRVKSYEGSYYDAPTNESELSDPIEGTTRIRKPNAPDWDINAVEAGKISITWDAVSGAQSYSVYRSLYNADNYSRMAEGLTDTSYTDSGVTAGTLYDYAVSATDNDGLEGDMSYREVFAPATAAPTITYLDKDFNPFGTYYHVKLEFADVTGSNGTGDVYISDAENGDYTELKYNMPVNSDRWLGESSWASGGTYYFKVALQNTSGSLGEFSAPEAITLDLAKPESFTASNDLYNKIELDWDSVVNAIDYGITDEDGWPRINPDNYDQISYTHSDSTWNPGHSEEFRIWAYSSNSSSWNPEYATGSLAAPTSIATITAGSGTAIELSWTDSPAAVNGYEIYRSYDQDGPYQKIGDTASGVTSYTDTTADSNIYYSYKVLGVDRLRESFDDPDSDYIMLKTGNYDDGGNTLDTPALTQTSTGSYDIDLDWQDTNGADAYHVTRKISGYIDNSFIVTASNLRYNVGDSIDPITNSGMDVTYQIAPMRIMDGDNYQKAANYGEITFTVP